jgi:hypothetical protein
MNLVRKIIILVNRPFAVCSVFLILLSFLIFYPVYAHTAATPKGSVYTKVHGTVVADYYIYLSVIRQGRIQSDVTDQYTTENTSQSQLHLFYILLGKIGKITGASDIFMYYAAMYMSFVILFFGAYFLSRLFLPQSWIWVALSVIFLAGAWPGSTGWWTYMDVYKKLTLIPHHYFAAALEVWAVVWFMLFIRKRKTLFAILSGLTIAVANIFLPVPGFVFTLSILLLTFGVLLFKRTTVKSFIWLMTGVLYIVALSGITIFYQYLELTTLGFPWTEVLKWEFATLQAERYPYTLGVYCISFGVIPLFILGNITNLKKTVTKERVLLYILIIVPMILYEASVAGILKINKIRYAATDPYVFGGILAVYGLYTLHQMLKSRVKNILFFSLVGCVLAGNILAGLYSYWWKDVRTIPMVANIYIPQAYLDTLSYLDTHTPHYSRVLSTYYVGIYVPAYSYSKSFLSHEVNTLDFWKKWGPVEAFYNGAMNEHDAASFLSEYHLQYMIWDAGELPRVYAPLFQFLYRSGRVGLYKVL